MSLLRAERLRRRYGRRLVVDVDALEVGRGGVLAVLGPNGAGKSTLFRLLLLVEAADEGRILLDGRDVRPGDRAAALRLAGVFQRPYLFAGTVAENVAYGLAARGVPRRDRDRRVAEVLELLDLAALARAPVHALSGGEAQRVALGRALAPRPELLLLDEPTANLDVTVRRRFREDLERLIRAQAGAAILITHDPADAFALADRIAVLEKGRIVQCGAPDEIVLHPATPFVAAFTGAELLLDGRVDALEDGVVVVALEGTALRLMAAVEADGGPPPGTRVHVAYRPEDVVLARPEASAETSARNRVPARVAALTPAGGLVRVRLEGDVALTALVTRRAVEALDLAPGREVVAQLKAAATRVYPAG
ncbi:MAG TPA: ABC transporter ATP-binding protein [Longimicrobiales bacterium]